jgi:hypothetical protein
MAIQALADFNYEVGYFWITITMRDWAWS